MTGYEPTYQFYTATYGGALDSGSFVAMLRPAVARVDELVFPNEPDDDTLEAYQMAVCAALDSYAENGTARGSGFSIGSFHVNGDTRYTAPDALAAAAARPHLVGTGLLFRGIA